MTLKAWRRHNNAVRTVQCTYRTSIQQLKPPCVSMRYITDRKVSPNFPAAMYWRPCQHLQLYHCFMTLGCVCIGNFMVDDGGIESRLALPDSPPPHHCPPEIRPLDFLSKRGTSFHHCLCGEWQRKTPVETTMMVVWH